MLKFLSKVTVLLMFMGGVMFIAPSQAFAQKLSMGMSASDYVKNKFTGDVKTGLAGIFDESKIGEKIVCGDSICDKETQICLKCTRKRMEDNTSSTELSYNFISETIGKCVSKETQESDFESVFAECGTMRKRLSGIGDTNVVTYHTIVQVSQFLKEKKIRDGLTARETKEKNIFTDKNNKSYQIFLDNSKPTLAYGENDFEGCEVLPVKVYNMRKCFFCGITNIIYDMAEEITENSFKLFARSFQILMTTFFVLWLAIFALRQVFPFTKKDASDFFELIIKQSFKFLIAFYLLSHSTFIFEYFIAPVLQTGLKMGQNISVLQDVNMGGATQEYASGKYFNVKIGNSNLHTEIEKYLTNLQSKLSYIQAIGGSLFCVGSRHLKIFSMGAEYFISGIRMMVLGSIFMLVGLLISIVFAFYFLDAIIQLALLGAMMPLMIAGWPFKKTSGPASTGLEFLLNTFFVFFFTGFVISVNIELINQSIGLVNSDYIKKSGVNNSFESIAQALNDQSMENLSVATNIGGMGFMLLVFSSIFGFMFLKEVTPMAGKLSGGAVDGISSKVGGSLASMAKGAASKVTKPMKDAYNKAGGAVGLVASKNKHLGNAMQDIGAANGSKALSNFGKALSKGSSSIQNFAKKIRS